MKHTKKLLTLLLALALGLGLGAPAAFAQTTVDWDDFYILTQPQAAIVPYGSSFTLSVEVNVPEGVKVVSYVWRPYIGTLGAGTGSVLHLSPGDYAYPEAYRPYLAATEYYHCIITAVEEDANGNPVGSPWELYSQNAGVTVLAERDMYFWESWGERVTQGAAGLFLYAYVGIIWFLGILMAPIYWIRDLFR